MNWSIKEVVNFNFIIFFKKIFRFQKKRAKKNQAKQQ